ncbi:hypothetical protein [Dehalobacter sp. TBBPA1]|uniref:hypothetical protein n=1 Tax=Dehalobacter sp. TBBPA1 TaxID=3235037 RepID=UPI0034A30815
MFGHNKGLGIFPQGIGGMPGESMMGMTPRQLNLVASEGFSGNGMATIGTDNNFSVIAHLPPAHTFSPHAPAVYAAYLVDGKGKNGFYAGTLRPAGNGMYQANFRSPVPLVHYDKVVISLESPQSIMQSPQGPIVMKVKEGFFPGLGPVKKAGSNMWGKVRGFVGSRFGSKDEISQNQPAPGQNSGQIPAQPPVQQYSQQPQQSQIPQYSQQPQNQQYPNYSQNPQYLRNSQQQYPQYAAQQRAYPQQGYPQWGAQMQPNRQRYDRPYMPQGGYQQGPVYGQNPASQVSAMQSPMMQTPASPAPVQPMEFQPTAQVPEQPKSQPIQQVSPEEPKES